MVESDYIKRARNGDGDAVRELYNRYAPRVYAVVRRLAGDDALAEDWAQEAWVRAIRALPSFRGDSRFSTWLHRMRQVLVLHDVEGYTHEEIATFLGVTAGTSKSQLFKARARMRKLLRPSLDTSSEEEVCNI
jgi:RNA polymerase sigma-70 factor (ECF subfamily)